MKRHVAKSIDLIASADRKFAEGTTRGLSAAHTLYKEAVEHLFQALSSSGDGGSSEQSEARLVKLELEIYLEMAETCDELLGGAEAADLESALTCEARAAELLHEWPRVDKRSAALFDLATAAELMMGILDRYEARSAKSSAVDWAKKRTFAIITRAETLKKAGVVAVAATAVDSSAEGSASSAFLARGFAADVALTTVNLPGLCELTLPEALCSAADHGSTGCSAQYTFRSDEDHVAKDGVLVTAARKDSGQLVGVLVQRCPDASDARRLAQAVTMSFALALRGSLAAGSVRRVTALRFEGVLDNTRCWLEFASAVPRRGSSAAASSDTDAAPLQSVPISEWVRSGGAYGTTGRDWQVQSAFQQLLQTLAVLHSTNIIAGVVDEVNTRVISGAIETSGSAAPLIEGTGGGASAALPPPPICTSSNRGGDAVSSEPPQVVLCPVPISTSMLRRQSVCAPELLGGGAPTAASDIWAVGALLFEAAIGRAAVLRPGESAIGIPAAAQRPARRGGIGDRLCLLLPALLARDPSARLRASEALGHPYFAVSLAPTLWAEQGLLVALQRKHEALAECIASMRRGVNGRTWSLRVTRSLIISSVVEAFLAVVPERNNALLRRLRVTFEGEAGVDAGGLTSEMYQSFFDALVSSDCALFECASGDGVVAPAFLPTQIRSESTELSLTEVTRAMEGIGRVIVKSLYDGQPIPPPFAPSLYKWLLGIPPNLHDLEAFDPMLGKGCRSLMEMVRAGDDDGIEAMMLDFGDVGGDEDEEVTLESCARYVQSKVQYVILLVLYIATFFLAPVFALISYSVLTMYHKQLDASRLPRGAALRAEAWV